MSTQTDRALFLRRSLQLDGVATGLTGGILLVAAQPLSALLGIPAPGMARAVGAFLVVFAAALLWHASRTTLSRGEALLTVVLNATWVAGSVAVLVAGPLTLLGNLAVAVVAAAVLVFAVLEAAGLRRLREA
jgi:hypothetical protein